MNTSSKKKKSLAESFPELAKEWHPLKNLEINPSIISPNSHLKAWWICKNGHEYRSVISNRTRKGQGCRICKSFFFKYPEISKEWHPVKNSNLKPIDIGAKSNRKLWWKCAKGHEWQAVPYSRGKSNTGCPYCAGQKINLQNSLLTLFPQIAKDWHPTKNGNLTSDKVRPNSHRKVWWICDKGHEFESSISNKKKSKGCPTCFGTNATKYNSLLVTHPKVSKEWHPTKNNDKPEMVKAQSHKKIWWKCKKGHEWQAVVYSRTINNNKCPVCNSLALLYPEIAKQWHPSKNNTLKPENVPPGSTKKVWWQCLKNSNHNWEVAIEGRVSRKTGCPYCAGQKVTVDESLGSIRKDIIKEWHPIKNNISPFKVREKSGLKVWWKCKKGHEWEAIIVNRTFHGQGCPVCAGRRIIKETSFLFINPELAKEWHPTKNGNLHPDKISPNSHKKIWWKCSNNPTHEWETTVDKRARGSGCPICLNKWTVLKIRHFIKSLIPQIENLTPAELYLLFQQNGLLNIAGHSKGSHFVNILTTGRFPHEELEKFANNEPSIVDEFITDHSKSLENLDDLENDSLNGDQANELIEETEITEDKLPVVQTKDILKTLDSKIITSSDEEAIQFLLASARAKIWKHTFADEENAIKQINNYSGDKYSEKVKGSFFKEYNGSKNLKIPKGYAFHVKGKLAYPNLMQRWIAFKIKKDNALGNWSGTGAGKTLSAILASRIVNAKLTVICCPNSIVDGWGKEILNIFPDSVIETKTLTPNWSSNFTQNNKNGLHRYLVLNYEKFQQPNSLNKLKVFLKTEKIDFIIIDEIHFAKQRIIDKMSIRKKNVGIMIAQAREINSNLRALGMSATPVINNLQEGKSLIEMITGLEYNDLNIKPTVSNCMKLYQKLVTLGIRWMPEYDIEYEKLTPEIDCSDYLDEIKNSKINNSPLGLENILTRVRLPEIKKHIIPKTIIYTYYIQGIDKILKDELEKEGWSVGFFTGDDKSGLDEFINGNLDVLIGTSAIGTGVDKLQYVCNKLIINVLPWTSAEYEQLKGRIFRQGQIYDKVTIVIPVTYAEVNGIRWSWCESKLNRINFKKSIADAAVDGVVPEGHLRSPSQAYQDLMGWLKRLDEGKVDSITRQKIIIPFITDEPEIADKKIRKYGDFSKLNHRWNASSSKKTHDRITKNPEEWEHYHSLYREARKDWKLIPYEEIIKWARKRSDYTIGDFGCGEAIIAQKLSDIHTVYSFDHIAINDDVVSCDIAHVPLEDETLDVAVFSLSLMGSNFTEYIREAHRTLKIDGQLHIIEATSRFKDIKGFNKNLGKMGFEVASSKEKYKFTHIRAQKVDEKLDTSINLKF